MVPSPVDREDPTKWYVLHDPHCNGTARLTLQYGRTVLSMLAEPNVESGANIDACKMWRDNRAEYEDKIRADVRRSLGLA